MSSAGGRYYLRTPRPTPKKCHDGASQNDRKLWHAVSKRSGWLHFGRLGRVMRYSVRSGTSLVKHWTCPYDKQNTPIRRTILHSFAPSGYASHELRHFQQQVNDSSVPIVSGGSTVERTGSWHVSEVKHLARPIPPRNKEHDS